MQHYQSRIRRALPLAGLASLTLAVARPAAAQVSGPLDTAPFSIQAVAEGLREGRYTIQVPIGVASPEGSALGRTPLAFPIELGTPLRLEAPPSGELGRLTLRFERWERDGELLGTDPELAGTASDATTLTAVYRLEPDSPPDAQEPNAGHRHIIHADEKGIPGTPVKPGASDKPPVKPAIPLTPIKPGPPKPPVKPSVPLTPIKPVIPLTPVKPTIPGTPIKPHIPLTPIKPGPPKPPVKPDIPGTPVKPGPPKPASTPVYPGTPTTPG
jgi:hypothetical protein